MKSFFKSLQDRGYIYQVTDISEVETLFDKEKVTAYIGFDCTAQSLHIGSLVQLMLLSHLRNNGHNVIVLLGSATTRIGDPSDKTEMRKMLSNDEIESNKTGIEANILRVLGVGKERASSILPNELGDRIIKEEGKGDIILVDNASWLSEIKYLDFLRDIGRYISVNKMLSFDSVKNRLEREQNLSFLEFNYMLLQAYDFLELYKRYNCKIQFGGSEQWGNIVSGIALAKRIVDTELFGFTTPLITNSSGNKMGKTAEGAVWLSEQMLSPYDFWQFWRNVNDSDIEKFLKLYTYISLENIQSMITKIGIEENPNKLKIELANEITTICHGKKAAEEASEKSAKVYEDGNMEAVSEIEITMNWDSGKIMIYKLLHKTGICESSSDARRLIKGGGVRVNNEVVTNELEEIDNSEVMNSGVVFSIGKKRYYRIKYI